MKKIIIFLSLVCLIVTCFTITTFAEEVDPVSDNVIPAGHWRIVENPEKPVGFSSISLNFSLPNSTRKYVALGFTSTSIQAKEDAGSQINVHTFYNYDTGEFPLNRVIILSNDTLISNTNQYNWFISNFENATECDGTACPVGDADLNNICDDCGLPMTMSLRSTLLDHAISQIERAIADDGPIPSGEYWMVSKLNSTDGSFIYKLYISQYPFFESEEDSKLYAGPTGQSLIHQALAYTDSDDGEHHVGGWSSADTGNIPFDPATFVTGSHDKSFFFRIPLWEEVQGVAQGEIQNKTLNSLGGVMTTLTVCGISLAALVLVLVLLSRKFRIFLR